LPTRGRPLPWPCRPDGGWWHDAFSGVLL
jgi:hypothetical protein